MLFGSASRQIGLSSVDSFPLQLFCNLITISVQNCNKYPELFDVLRNTEKLYLEAENNFKNNEKLLISGSDLFKNFLNQKKVTEILEKLIKNNTSSKMVRCNYAYNNNFSYSWDAKKYYEYSQDFKNFFPKLKCKKISEINYKDNKKIKLGFISGNLCDDHSVTYFLKNTFKTLGAFSNGHLIFKNFFMILVFFFPVEEFLGSFIFILNLSSTSL